MENLDVGMATFTDEKLFALCRKYGAEARLWRQKFMGLLPEVNRRRLFEKKGFGSIFEFSKKLAGLSEDQVRLVLNLEKNFSDRPALKKMLVDGKASLNKLARVVSVAKPEDEGFWADQVEILPNRALETLVRDAKWEGRMTEPEGQNGLLEPLFEAKSLHVQTEMRGDQNHTGGTLSAFLELEFSSEVVGKLLDLKRKGIDINELVLKMLGERVQRIEEKKDEILEKMQAKAAEKRLSEAEFPVDGLTAASRYIAVEIQRVLKEEHGTKCSIETCRRKAQNIHHAQRFALSQNHDPHFLAPLCREHHLIAHSIDLKFHEKRVAAIGCEERLWMRTLG